MDGPAALAKDLAGCALALARVFAAGGRLVVVAPGRDDHARHVAVEFVHPAVTGAQSLPAMATTCEQLSMVMTPADAVVIIDPLDGQPISEPPASLVLRVPKEMADGELVRWYHVLWELVHVGLEHPGLTGGAASEGGDSTGFLYPFLDAAETDVDVLLGSMAASAKAKFAEADCRGAAAVTANEATLAGAAATIVDRIARGGHVFTIGNGGSACDAARLTRLLTDVSVRSTCLAADPVIMSALANDLGAEQIFARQVDAMVRSADVLVSFSTSGASANLMRACDLVAGDVCVIASAGYGGGLMVEHDRVDYMLVVDSASVHRIQEAQSCLIDALVERVKSQGGVRS